jgi:hypothetical protein
MKLNPDEQETHFNIVASNRAMCEIYTDDPVWIKRLGKWFEPEHGDEYGAKFLIPTSLIIRESSLVTGTSALEAIKKSRKVI